MTLRRPSRLARTIVLGTALAAAWTCLPASALAGCPLPEQAELTLASVDPAKRLAWIDHRLTSGERTARIWKWGWIGGFGAAAVGSLVAVPFVAPENRVDYYTGAVSAGVGVATLLIVPPAVLDAAPTLQARIASSPPGADVCPVLQLAEADLARVARDEERQGAWYVHVGNVLFNLGLGLFLGFGYHHWEAAAINFGAGAAVGEALILTRPTATIDDLATYRAGRF